MTTFRKTALCAAVAAAMLPGLATAGATWSYNYADAFAADGVAALPVGVPALSGAMNEVSFRAEARVEFTDGGIGGVGVISPGDTFKDYISFRVNNFLGAGAVDVTDPLYGTGGPVLGLAKNHGISGRVYAEGVQLTANTYSVTHSTIEFFFDAGDGTGAGYTQAIWAAGATGLDSFVDGVLVESGVGVGAGTNSGIIPNGGIVIRYDLTDILSTLDPSYGEWEIFQGNQISINLIQGLVGSDNNICQTASDCSIDDAAINGLFGLAGVGGDFSFLTASDGSFTKEFRVPEPTSLALTAIALFGMGCAARRRNAS